jgi:hypothetical protein
MINKLLRKWNALLFAFLIGKWLCKMPFDYKLAGMINKCHLSRDAHEAYVMLMGASDPASEHLRQLVLTLMF